MCVLTYQAARHHLPVVLWGSVEHVRRVTLTWKQENSPAPAGVSDPRHAILEVLVTSHKFLVNLSPLGGGVNLSPLGEV